MHFRPAQSRLLQPGIQGHTNCTYTFIKCSHKFVRINFKTPVCRRKYMFLSCRAVQDSC